ncbi:uncharacterized protein EV422DRAFT_541593 [Fimicolochytrium jonesii]|uniref:uncharacterized protein n=1 Tax=Fimicolochytrium jonesii TaxID=1396493 RepID=UPI0022FEE85E|nr:uncharacterized protein EV422DRAFT_541593 [Fimicolochytrium jonesii]KAI8817382.1 hypothetical protein EV422DRAFT_541593 [Fimicolochytrium jonesii]
MPGHRVRGVHNHGPTRDGRTLEETRLLSEGSSRALRAEEAKDCYEKALEFARNRLVEPVSNDEIAESKEYVTDAMITELKILGPRACVCGALAASRELNQRAKLSTHRSSLLKARAYMCEVMAIRIVEDLAEDKDGREELFVEVLTPLFTNWKAPHKQESPLSIAVESGAVSFVNTIVVQQCVEYIWRGLLIPRPSWEIKQDSRDGDGYVQGYQWPTQIRSGFNALPEGRLSVPIYRYAAETMFSFALLMVFTFVVNYRTPHFNAAEIIMYIMVGSYMITEIKQFRSQGTGLYFLTLFNCNDMISLVLFSIAFGAKVYAQWIGSEEILTGPTDLSYDLLACNAVFLWTRAIHVLAGFRYFGEMVVIIRSMLQDAAYFFVMFFFVLVGFVQAFAGLARASPSEGPGFAKGGYLLAKAFLQAPDFEDAERMHDVLGPPLLIFFQILGTVIMLNMLVAFFNQSYSTIIETATEQHVYQFTVNVLGLYLDATRYPFIPPANLVEPFLKVPSLFLSEQRYLALRRWVWVLAVFPANLAIAIAEEAFPQLTAQLYQVKEDQDFEEEQRERRLRKAEDAAPVESEPVTGGKGLEKEGKKIEAPELEEDAGVQETLKFLVKEIRELRLKLEEKNGSGAE